MMALTFYYFPASFFSQRAFLALEEKGIPYRRKVVSIHSGEQLEPWYMRIQPNGTVPTLAHGDIVKMDSKDIILYLDEIAPDAPKLYPDPSTPGADRVAYFAELMQNIRIGLITYGSACYRQHSHHCKMPKTFNVKSTKSRFEGQAAQIRKLADENPDLKELYLAKLNVHNDRDLTNEDGLLAALKECDSIVSEIENELSQKWNGKLDNFSDSDPWLCCNHFTMADIYLATLLHRLYFVGQEKRFWGNGKRPYLAAYYTRVQQRKSFKTACGSAHNPFRSMILPKWKYQMRKAFPRLLGYSVVAGTIGFAVYVQYKGLPSWWPNNLKYRGFPSW